MQRSIVQAVSCCFGERTETVESIAQLEGLKHTSPQLPSPTSVPFFGGGNGSSFLLLPSSTTDSKVSRGVIAML